ncbi:MAG: acetyl-CoA decarbonylase/synthase complex subunit gamma [Desulfovibrionaceae bacterium]|nr:acetyl-CoA decarbonylase/synthase complex subunit gamma [Desulfovibrionaceae bacterium]
MALTGLQIQKLLPKTNCKECGSNTCLAFAMKLAAKKADLAECPYASDEARTVLGAASRPPMRTLGLGPQKKCLIGGETVMFRHEKTFVHQTALAATVSDADPGALAAAAAARDYVLVRVGEELRLDLICLTNDALAPDAFAEAAGKIHKATRLPLIARSASPLALAKAAEALAGSGSILASAGPESLDTLAAAAKRHGHALAVTAPDLDGLAERTKRAAASGFEDLILDFTAYGAAERFQTMTIARRAALKNECRELGYPCIAFVAAPASDADAAVAMAQASGLICKYASVLAAPGFDPAFWAPLLTLRQNIYTDPQKPIQVEPGVYPIGEPGPCSPVFVTTNFSLTYFLVSGEIENAGLSAWLAVPDCEGMSVLTSWAAGKFSGASVAKFIAERGLAATLEKKVLVLPGYVAQIKGEAEEGLPGWTVLVGPQEVADLESFAKTRLG